MIVPMILGGVLQSAGAIEIELPQWLLAVTYAFLGWRIGLGFTREIVLHAVRAFPAIFGSILTLLAFCGGLAFLLNKAAGVDALTAYLATSPGGLDSVAIIASTSRVDLQFVMALQTLRFAVIVIAGPPLARMVARRLG
jgi:membrane AbrB-like protein